MTQISVEPSALKPSEVSAWLDADARGARRDHRLTPATIEVLRRVLPRAVGDLLAVGVGLTVFSLMAHPVSAIDTAWAIGFVLLAIVMDSTHKRTEWNYVEEFVVALKTSFCAILLTSAIGFLLGQSISRIMVLSVAAAMTVIKPTTAAITDRAIGTPRRQRQLAFVLCSDDEYAELSRALRDEGDQRRQVVRLADGEGAQASRNGGRSPRDLLLLAQNLHPQRVVFGESADRDPTLLGQIAEVNLMGVSVRSFSRYFEEEFGRVPLVSLETSWFLFDISPLHRLGYRIARRVVDIVAGLLSGLLFLVLLPVIVVLVKLGSRGPIFYVQPRVGQGGRIFNIVKIRTMEVAAEWRGPAFTEVRDRRVTRTGRLLRRTRLDELPQAWNLLRGDMSLIGPRPEQPEWVRQFGRSIPYYEKRHVLRPGLTGWAQVHEGYCASVDGTVRKLERDLYYLRYRSLGLDLRIVMATVGHVLRLSGR